MAFPLGREPAPRRRRLFAASSAAAIGLALGGCSSPPPASPEPAAAQSSGAPSASPTRSTTGTALRTLAKVDDWRADLTTPPDVLSALEIAYDAGTAQRMWQDNIPADLPDRQGDPAEPGRYGDLSSVDFTDQVVALWSSGQSGSCPGWASGLRRSEAGDLVVEEAVETGGNDTCSDDRRVYRTVVVIGRADVPAAPALGSTTATDGDSQFPRPVLLTTYPAP